MTAFSRHNLYSAWDGSQEPLPIDAEDGMNRISEDVFAGREFELPMRRGLSSGWRNPGGQRLAGIEELVEMVRRRRLEQLNRYNPETLFEDIRERLDGLVRHARKTN